MANLNDLGPSLLELPRDEGLRLVREARERRRVWKPIRKKPKATRPRAFLSLSDVEREAEEMSREQIEATLRVLKEELGEEC